MSNYIPYGRQNINQQDIDAVIEVLRSPFITQGPAIANFEKAIAEYCGVKYAVATSSATAALHIACLALDLGEGDRLWTSPNTFVASANCGRYCGAKIDFVDINPRTYNLSVDALEKKLSLADKVGQLPTILIPVHFAGQSCEMEKIAALTRQYDIKIIEDASHAIGGRYQGKPIGCCQYSDIAVFSFHPVKIITTGEGGIVLTNRSELYEKLIRLRTHGITRNPKLMQGKTEGLWYYQQLELGFNYRITDIQAALGLSQLQRLDEFVEKRKQLTGEYDRLLANLPVILPWQHPETASSWHLYVIRLKLEEIDKTHSQIFTALREAKIGVNLHYIPVHTQPYYRQFGFQWGDFPQAEKYYREAMSLPLYPSLIAANRDKVVKQLHNILL